MSVLAGRNKWHMEFMKLLTPSNEPTKYTEPVSEFTVHMEMSMLAFVRAETIFTINGERKNKFEPIPSQSSKKK